MDLDAYARSHAREWDRLDALARQRRLSGDEADELIDRYRSGATHLSIIKTQAGSTALGDRLSVSLSRARLRFTGTGRSILSQIPEFVVAQLPAALYRLRWWTLGVAVGTALVSVLYAWWILGDPRVLAAISERVDVSKLANHDFTSYYSENPAASFAGQVWTNNAWIAAQCIAFGIVGVYVPSVLVENAKNVGVSAAVMFSQGHGDTFFAFIAPHGMLELTSVFVAAAAGLRIFWAWVAPGPHTRRESLARNGRGLVIVAIGLVASLFVSGIIEGFVTPAPWPWPVKVGIGALALAAFLAYMLVLGRRAVRAGETGDLDEVEAGARRLVAG